MQLYIYHKKYLSRTGGKENIKKNRDIEELIQEKTEKKEVKGWK